MANLLRNSQFLFTRAACLTRASSTTSTSAGGAKVKPSGVSDNLSQASRMADGTDSALRDAEQRKTASKSTAGGSARSSPAEGSSTPWGKIGFLAVFAVGSYYVYENFIKSQGPSKNSKLAHAHGSSKDSSAGGKH